MELVVFWVVSLYLQERICLKWSQGQNYTVDRVLRVLSLISLLDPNLEYLNETIHNQFCLFFGTIFFLCSISSCNRQSLI